MPELKIQRGPDAADLPLPAYQTELSAGLDLHASCRAPITIAPGEIKLVPTGLFVEIPPGTIDADYRGELQVILGNVGAAPYTIERGMRFAQLVIAPIAHVTVVEVDELSDTARGEGGFGHTGR